MSAVVFYFQIHLLYFRYSVDPAEYFPNDFNVTNEEEDDEEALSPNPFLSTVLNDLNTGN